MKKIILIFFFILTTIIYIIPDTTDDKIETPSIDKYIEILTYGIEEEVVNIIKNLGNSPGKEIYDLLTDRYREALLPSTKIALIRFFTDRNNLPDNIINLLYEDVKNEPENLKLFTALLTFLGKKGNVEHGKFLIKCLDNYDDLIRTASADALTEMKNIEMATPILNRLKEAEINDEKYLSDDIKGKLILSLGKVKAKEASEFLSNIIKDSSNNKFLIMYSMVSLAEIQDFNSINIIKNNLNNEEIRIQEYAGYALSKFKTSSVIPILKLMLKHNNEKIRIFACQGIVENNDIKSTNILLYKYKNDPSEKVKYEALKSLVLLGTTGIDSIKKYIKNNKLQDSDIYIISKAVTEKPDNNNIEYLISIFDSIDDKKKEIIAKNIISGTSNKLDPILNKLLNSDNQYIRVNAIKTVSKIKDSTLWNKVNELSQNDPSKLVKKMAKYYIELRKL